MADSTFTLDTRDIEFNMWEYLGLEKILEHQMFEDFDKPGVEILMDEGFKMAKEVIAPTNTEGDRVGCVFEDGKVKVPPGFHAPYKTYAENGWIGLNSPQQYGGIGAPNLVHAAISEAICGASLSFAMYPGLTAGAANLMLDFCSDEIKEAYLPKMYSGEWGGTMCLTESGAGSALADLKSMAYKQDDGTYKIEGQKIFISSGEEDLTENTIHLVLTRTPDAPAGIKGVSIFVVPKYLLDEKGEKGEFNDVHCLGIEHKMGIKGSATCTISFGDDNNCKGYLIGEEGQGIKIMFHMMNEARLGVGFLSSSTASAAYQEAVAYAKERVQGTDIRQFKDPNAPRIPIIQHPDVRRMLMTMKAYTQGFRALLYKVAYLSDLVRTTTDEAERSKSQGMIDLLTPICKSYCSDYGFKVNEMAVQTLGGYGYINEYPLEQYMRDQKITSIYEGTNGIQALDLVGRKLNMKGGMVYFTFLQDITDFVAANKENEMLGEVVAALEPAKDVVQTASMTLASKGMMGDAVYPAMCACDFLNMFGNLVTALLLCEHAVLASEKLKAIMEERGVDKDGLAKLIEDNPEAEFYRNKIKVAEFFVKRLLPANDGLAKTISSEDLSALEVTF